jgi:hypothetical protein
MTLRRLAITWVMLAAAMTINGITREAVLRPLLPGEGADVLSALLGAVIILGLTGAMFRDFHRSTTSDLVVASLLLVTMTVAFEFALGRWVDRKSWSELLANYEFWKGRLWSFLLLLLAATPFIWGRWRAPRSAALPDRFRNLETFR